MSCRHNLATFDQRKPGLPIAYRCPCGARTVRGSFRAALEAFRERWLA